MSKATPIVTVKISQAEFRALILVLDLGQCAIADQEYDDEHDRYGKENGKKSKSKYLKDNQKVEKFKARCHDAFARKAST
jgi:hypothetical protein